MPVTLLVSKLVQGDRRPIGERPQFLTTGTFGLSPTPRSLDEI